MRKAVLDDYAELGLLVAKTLHGLDAYDKAGWLYGAEAWLRSLRLEIEDVSGIQSNFPKPPPPATPEG